MKKDRKMVALPFSSSPNSITTRRFSINVVSNIARVVIAAVTWMVLTPLLISNLGIEAYGVVALAFSVYKMVSFMDGAIRTPFVRFFTLAIKSGRSESANVYFNTGLFSTLFVLCLSICISPVVMFYGPRFLTVPAGYELESGFLIAAGLLAGILPMVQNIFESIPFAQNRLDLVNLSLASKNIIFLTGIFTGFYVFGPILWHVGIWFILSGLGSLAIASWIWRKLRDSGLKINWACFRLAYLKDMVSMGSWLSLNQAGGVMLFQVNVFIVNVYLGAEVQGRFSAVQQWEMLVRIGAAALSSALIPVLLERFATKGKNELVKLGCRATKLLGIALSFPVGLLVGLSGPLMSVWLGPEYRNMAPLVVVLIAPLCITAAFQPLLSVQMTLNKIRWPAVVTLVSGLISILISICWVHWLPELGLGVALAGVIGLLGKHIFFTPIYTSRILNVPWKTFFLPILPGILGTLVIGLVSYTLSVFWYPDSWFEIGLLSCVSVIPYCFFVFRICLDVPERTLLCNVLAIKK